jgi:hypothetical protein
MTEALPTLIRLGRRRLDEGRRALAALLNRADEVAAEIARLDVAIAGERDAARAAAPVVAAALGPFVANAIAERRRLEQTRAAVNSEIAVARDRLAADYRDLCSLEQAEAERRRRHAEGEARREHLMLDELALLKHRRPLRGDGGTTGG